MWRNVGKRGFSSVFSLYASYCTKKHVMPKANAGKNIDHLLVLNASKFLFILACIFSLNFFVILVLR